MILLDTHVWIWWNMEPERVPPYMADALNEDDDLVVSSVAVWETMLLFEKGRVAYELPPGEVVRSWIATGSSRAIPLEAEVAILSRTLAFNHQDPADRFIAATAFHLDVPLATADERLLALPWLKRV